MLSKIYPDGKELKADKPVMQKNFRKVLRSTLYSVRGSSPTEWEEHKARRRALSLYRWTKGAKGLAL